MASAIENILTRGLDAAATVFSAKYQVNDPAPKVASQRGPGSVNAGTSAVGAMVGSVPTWVWAAGGAALLLLVVPRLLRR